MKNKRKKIKKSVKTALLLLIVLILIIILIFVIKSIFGKNEEEKMESYLLAGVTKDVQLYDLEYQEKTTLPRGTKIDINIKETVTNEIDNQKYYNVTYKNNKLLVKIDNVSKEESGVVLEKTMYVRTPVTIYKNETDGAIAGLAEKGAALEITGFDKISEEGIVNMYKIKYDKVEGYVYRKYLVETEEEALQNYEPDKYYTVHEKRKAGDLDYYPVDKPKFEDNVMPDEVRSLYLNSGGNVIGNVDAYIELAKESNINAFVVDIKDNTSPAYASPVMEKWSPTNFKRANNSYDKYKAAIQKLKDNGFYVIGRITVFKDSYFATDHPEYSILSKETGEAFKHNGSYWPSAYQRGVWEFNVELAKEAVTEIGFNEIQFDYARFPDRSNDSVLDFRNTYDETKSQAIQRFLMYACDELHKVGAYVSVDVFGESAHQYITAYGQYWAAMSNVVDVISGMPYPDHFSKYEYGFDVPVWTVPYKLLKVWGGDFVMKRQAEAPTPAIVRTWIQTYSTGKDPATVYDATKISEQIAGLYDAGLTGGFMTWNAGSSLSKYKEVSAAFKKEY